MPSPCNYLHTDVHLSGRSFRRARISITSNGSEAVRHARAKKKGGGKKDDTGGRGRGGERKRGGEEGTRIWPLQLEERGKAEVANPCKEPLYFLKEVLRAPDALPPPGLREKDRRGPRRITGPPVPSHSLLCRPRVTATRAARFQHVSTTTAATAMTATWEESRADPIHLSPFLRRDNGVPS